MGGFFRAWWFYEQNYAVLPEWQIAGLFTFMGAMAGIIYKVYDSLQKDRGHDVAGGE